MARSNKENTISRSRNGLAGRKRRPTSRARHADEAAQEKAEATKQKKIAQLRRRALKDLRDEANLAVEQPGDSAEIRQLRAALVRAHGERDAAEAANIGRPRRRGPPARSIARPQNMSKVKISQVRTELGLADAKHDQEWSNLRTSVRRFMDAGLLDMRVGWKEQDTRRLIKIYDAIEGAYPDLERFRGQWAAAHLVHESFHAQKTYTSCKGKDGTYRARHRQRRCRSLADSDNEEGDQEWSGINPAQSPPPDPSSSPEMHSVEPQRDVSPPIRARPSGSNLPQLTDDEDGD
ncbi:hypothetical protein C8J57DRAFT_1494672 [Mycena rebaudengoi]|nr:hypothetical protein C8J57DRAFT_1494672 [Mycena rebaudengoi]